MANCPISIPALKNKRDRRRLSLFIPISVSAPAKPSPCNNPNPKAINQGVESYFYSSPTSKARYIIVNAMKASVEA